MTTVLEKYEWDNTWIEKTNEINAKRVLYIGDSISCGTRGKANRIAAGEIIFDGFGTSKALDNPSYFPSLSLFAVQEPSREAVLFNNGLHGWHLDEKEYARLYNDFIEKLINEFPNALILPVLTTFVTNGDFHNDRVIKRNEIVMKIAEEKKLSLIDLYTVSELNKQHLSNDGVHFDESGYEELAKEIVNVLNKKL